MTNAEQADPAANRYLLGMMSDQEREDFELQYLGDPAVSEIVAAAEADLLDAYARGELGTDERKRVQEHLLATGAQRARLAAAEALQAGLGRRTPAARGGWWWAGAAAALFAVAFTAWLLQWRREPAGVDGPVPVARRVPKTAAPDVKPSPQPVITPAVVTLTLASTMTRSGSAAPTLTIPAGTDAVRLVVGLEPGDDEYSSYRAVLQTISGTVVAKHDGLRADGGALQLEVQARSLSRGDYEVLVEGDGEPLGAWPFRVSL